jgi:AraC-like DNA-binding protein
MPAELSLPTCSPPPRDGEVRIGPLRPIAAVLRESGHDAGAVLVAAGLEPNAFDDPERRIAFHVAADLIRRGALLAASEDFGLQVGARFELEDLGLLGHLVWRASTVGEALQELNRFLHLQDRGSVSYLRPAQEGVVSLGYSIFDPDTPAAGLVYDLVLAMGMRLLRRLAGARFRVIEVWFAHDAPSRDEPWRRAFGAPLRFDAPRAEIHFAANWLGAPLAGADAMQHALVQRAITLVEASDGPDLVGRMRAAVRVLLLTGNASAACIAAALGLHERTLRRRLRAEGQTLQGVVAHARFDVACQLLRETHLGLDDIADALGYAEAAVFVRAFRGWAGCTPGQWRRRIAIDTPDPARR